MTRIIGGSAGGRRINTPRGVNTRPTSDRVREALFSAVESWCGSLEGLRVLDLYAGSGAIGLEARSRGAGVVTLVELDRRTAALIGDNARHLGFTRVEVVAGSVAATLSRPPAAPYDLAFSDPPYPLSIQAVEHDLAALVANDWLVPGALVVVERASRGEGPTWPDGLHAERSRKYGETTLWYGHAARSDERPADQDEPDERSDERAEQDQQPLMSEE
ncbi:MAG TPA: 16S rRNA (guanine(966)-N(2))-methyltransferase RsmD [Nocardioides sp.]